MQVNPLPIAYCVCCLTALPFFGAAGADTTPGFSVDVTMTGGALGMYTVNTDQPNIHVTAKSTDSHAHHIAAVITGQDIFGKPLPWTKTAAFDVTADGAQAAVDIPLALSLGYYNLALQFTGDGTVIARNADLGVIPPSAAGLRPESFFASNTSGFKEKADLDFLQKIGMKIERIHFNPTYGKAPDVSTGDALPIDFTKQDANLAATKAHGIWVLPVVGYALTADTRTELAKQVGMYGPPRNYDEFVNTWKAILQHYPEINTFEFWNEPWIFGWNWAADGSAYRKLQEQWCKMALRVNPNLRIVAGNSWMFTEDHIEQWPDCYKGLLSGTTHHPYTFSTGYATLRSGDQPRAMDGGYLVNNKRMGLPYYYLTEGGTQYSAPPSPEMQDLLARQRALTAQIQAIAPADRGTPRAKDLQSQNAALTKQIGQYPDASDNNQNAFKIVQYYVHAALTGCFQGNAQWQIGYGPGWTRANTTFAVMTHFLEDRPIVADIWPRNELIWGAVFANPRFVTSDVKALPRAAEIGARWSVAVPDDRAKDTTKVAVIWCNTGVSNDKVDAAGTLTIDNARGLHAFDLVGNEIPSAHGRLTVPFSEYPVYITCDSLDVTTFRSRIASARIEHATPVCMYAMSLMQPASEPQDLAVRIENELNVPVSAAIALTGPGNLSAKSAPFVLAPAQLSTINIRWPGVKPDDTNQYVVNLIAATDAGTSVKQQIVSVARFVKRTAAVDGTLNGWAGVTPVLLDSEQLQAGIDLSQYILNPGSQLPVGNPSGKRIAARVYTAYDNANIYFAAAVNQDQLATIAATPTVKGRGATKVTLPCTNGDPAGLNHVRLCGDAFQFAFGFRDRVPGCGRQMGDPYEWKGHYYDTDYEYIALKEANGDVLMRLRGPDTTRTDAFQLETTPAGIGPVAGAKIVISRDETAKLTIYTLSIPRSEIAMFDPSKGNCRFSFLIPNSEQVGFSSALAWGQAAGVFDHWYGLGTFSPNWMQTLPCQTNFGIEQ